MLPRSRIERYEMDMVRERRRTVRASWQACAEMVGRSVHDVRLACDPDYRPDFVAPVVSAPRLRLRDLDDVSKFVLSVLHEAEQDYQSDRRKQRDVAVAELMQRLRVGGNKVGKLLPVLETRGVVVSRRLNTGRFAWRLSPMGRELVGADG
ncbi:hypothetical protein [Caulobacter vibrioides]|uniref:hypothetical protein n=1 Tax=Caulobacter vibrioides TaxID=155892 RepID=UPI0015E768C5|nr:hypothetical protein [Caulobacter vibrioides]